jgi:hypothetical protein
VSTCLLQSEPEQALALLPLGFRPKVGDFAAAIVQILDLETRPCRFCETRDDLVVRRQDVRESKHGRGASLTLVKEGAHFAHLRSCADRD